MYTLSQMAISCMPLGFFVRIFCVLNFWGQIQPFNGLFSRTTWVSRYQKGKTNLDFTGARDSEWQWHQLGHMQFCTSLQTDNHASTPPLKFFTGRMPFLPPNQQRQSTEGIKHSKFTRHQNSFMAKHSTTLFYHSRQCKKN